MDGNQDQEDPNFNGRSVFEGGVAEALGEERFENWKETAQQWSEHAREWIMGHPFAALGIAVAAGFTVGRVVRR